MSETKYLSVIHKSSGQLVTAFKFEHDATWIGKEKDNLIATPVYCKEGQEVKMVFIKSFPKKNGTKVATYFRRKSGEVGLKSCLGGESIGHRLSKENIYSGLYSGEITIDGEKLNKDIVKNMTVEHRTYGENYVIFDVVVLFKEEHIKYGLGIFFEIQFSKQKNSETIKRSYDRVIEGFSGVWLFKDDFDSNYRLINKNIVISPYKKILKELEDLKESNFIKKINNYGKIIDEKLDNFEIDAGKIINILARKITDDVLIHKKDIVQTSKNEINKIEVENEKLRELKELAGELNFDSFKDKVNILFQEISKDIENKTEGIITDIKKYKNENELIYEKINKWKLGEVGIEKRSGLMEKSCPICNKDMKIGKAMAGYNWYCSDFPRCDGFIKGVGEYES